MAKKSSTSKKKQPAARAGRSAGGNPAAKPSASSKRPAKKKTTKQSTAKKPAAKKSPAKKIAARTASSAKSAKSKATTRSAPAQPKKKVAKKVANKSTKKATRTATKAPAKKTSQKKAATSRPAGSKAASRTASTKKSSAKKPSTKKSAAKKTTAKKTSTKKPASTSGNKSTKPASGTKASAKAGDKPARKGITIVSKQPERRSWPKRPPPPVPRIGTGGMPSLGSVFSKPLIPSGPATVAQGPKANTQSGKKPKCPYTKRQLDKFRAILIAKRTELIGGVADLEHEALKGTSGSLSNLPQHMAEQGSEAAEQTLSLNLAAAERRLIIEIDAALVRIADRTYGLCELTGKPINPERLEELPWTRYSIEAARELERRSYGS